MRPADRPADQGSYLSPAPCRAVEAGLRDPGDFRRVARCEVPRAQGEGRKPSDLHLVSEERPPRSGGYTGDVPDQKPSIDWSAVARRPPDPAPAGGSGAA